MSVARWLGAEPAQEESIEALLARSVAGAPQAWANELAADSSRALLDPASHAQYGQLAPGPTMRRALLLNVLLDREQNSATTNNLALGGLLAGEASSFVADTANAGATAIDRVVAGNWNLPQVIQSAIEDVARGKQAALGLAALATLLRIAPGPARDGS